MDLGIKGKKAIVCASSRGLGRGCALALAEAGCDLVVNGRDAKALAATAHEIRDRFGVGVTEVPGDVSQPRSRPSCSPPAPRPTSWSTTMAARRAASSATSTRQTILDGVTQNMITPIELIKAVIDGMAERGFGRIVNITSLSVYVPIPGLDVSSGARAGLTVVPGRRRAHGGERNVTINNLLPGKLDTDRLRGGFPKGGDEAEFKAKLAADIPARRLGTAEEFGQICAFLCSVHAGYLTGQNIPVDGGLYTSAF